MKHEILYNRPLGAGNFLMGVRHPDLAAGAKPGQFVMVKVADEYDPLLRRPMAVYRVPEPDVAEVLYKVVGRGTAILAEKRAGARIDVLGPLGRGFTMTPPEGEALVVTGGVGIASVVYPAQGLPREQVVSFYGGRSKADLVEAEVLAAASRAIYYATDDGSHGHAGFVTEPFEAYLADMEPDLRARSRVLCCGPEAMMVRVAAIARRHGVGACELALERHMGCGVGACLGCIVPKVGGGYMTICTVGPVVESSRIRWEDF
ncbi:MAG: dihydroorotate dehydrogenase electron transfer subunit [Myxococcales bacterium]|nr:dihydroorotate dehydrogenase electron transfer subunit [Myxococcales bacterium]